MMLPILLDAALGLDDDEDEAPPPPAEEAPAPEKASGGRWLAGLRWGFVLVYAFSRARSPGRLARFVVTARSAPWSDAAGAKHAPRGPFSVLERRHGLRRRVVGHLTCA